MNVEDRRRRRPRQRRIRRRQRCCRQQTFSGEERRLTKGHSCFCCGDCKVVTYLAACRCRATAAAPSKLPSVWNTRSHDPRSPAWLELNDLRAPSASKRWSPRRTALTDTQTRRSTQELRTLPCPECTRPLAKCQLKLAPPDPDTVMGENWCGPLPKCLWSQSRTTPRNLQGYGGCCHRDSQSSVPHRNHSCTASWEPPNTHTHTRNIC